MFRFISELLELSLHCDYRKRLPKEKLFSSCRNPHRTGTSLLWVCVVWTIIYVLLQSTINFTINLTIMLHYRNVILFLTERYLTKCITQYTSTMQVYLECTDLQDWTERSVAVFHTCLLYCFHTCIPGFPFWCCYYSGLVYIPCILYTVYCIQCILYIGAHKCLGIVQCIVYICVHINV